MKTKLGFSLIMALLVAGCASFTTNLYNTENVIADSAKAGVSTYNAYYRNSTNGATSEQLDKLNEQRAAVWDASKKLGVSLKVLDDFRLAYSAKQNTTNQMNAATALQVVSSQSSNLLVLIKTFVK